MERFLSERVDDKYQIKDQVCGLSQPGPLFYILKVEEVFLVLVLLLLSFDDESNHVQVILAKVTTHRICKIWNIAFERRQKPYSDVD